MIGRRLGLALLVASGLIVSFLLAFVGGQRALGGIVLIVIGLVCAFLLYRNSGTWPTVVTGVAYALGFVLSHPLGDIIGPWPAVLVVAVAVAIVAFAVNRGPARP